MLLTHELAQPIVDKTMAIIDKNINIMDHRAIIIASGDRSRLGSFHEGAARVIERGHTVEIYSRDVDLLRGVRPGVNLPINLGCKIVGVVGISGEPGEVRSNGELVRITVELMLEQLLFKEQVILENRARESFLHDLLSGENRLHGELFLARAATLGYDLHLPRYAIVMDVDGFGQVVREKLSAKGDLKVGELALQELKERILHSIERVFPSDKKAEIIAFAGGDKFVILKCGKIKSGRSQRRLETTELVGRIRKQIQRDTGLTVTAGIGRLYTDYGQYHCSFEEALDAIRIGQRLWGGNYIFWAEEMLVENLITTLPEEVLLSYVDEVMGPLLQDQTVKHRKEMFDTLEALFENGLNVTRTAQKLFVHRNTVLFRLERVKEIIGYRPSFSFRDAMELKLAIIAWKYLEKSKLP